jgi:S-adenosylmethionine-dependent methyltransferase
MVELVRRRSVAQTLALDLLTDQLTRWREEQQRHEASWADVVDLGGGTGGLAAHLAALGFRVTVVDPSPDALASLERRAADAGLTRSLVGRQGDAGDLVGLIGEGTADVALCHRVLDVVDVPEEALTALARVLRTGGVLSLLVPQRHAVVLTQALSGHVAHALRTWRDKARFSYDEVITMVSQAGFEVVAAHGIGAIAEHVPEALVEGDVRTYEDLAQLDRAVSQDPAFRALAPVVHVFAERR